jgi:GMP synthase-like glutamine amidotransferase
VGLTPHGCSEPLFGLWPAQFTAGHWHSDTFDLPAGIEPVLSSDGCRNQAFVYREHVVGLQFHLEWTLESLEALVGECGGDLPAGIYVQDPAAMLADTALFMPVASTLLFELLDSLGGVALGAS